MKHLNELEVLDFNLSSPLILPEGCAWQRIVAVSWRLGYNYADVSGTHLPSNWPSQAQLVTNPAHSPPSSLSLRWVINSAEDARAAVRAAMTISALPLQPSGPDQTDIHLTLGGSHGSPSIPALLSPFITAIMLLTPSQVPLSEVDAHLPYVNRICWPPTTTSEEDAALLASLLNATKIKTVAMVPAEVALSLLTNIERDITMSVSFLSERDQGHRMTPEAFFEDVDRIRTAKRLSGGGGAVKFVPSC